MYEMFSESGAFGRVLYSNYYVHKYNIYLIMKLPKTCGHNRSIYHQMLICLAIYVLISSSSGETGGHARAHEQLVLSGGVSHFKTAGRTSVAGLLFACRNEKDI
jgi:hypothetical protein